MAAWGHVAHGLSGVAPPVAVAILEGGGGGGAPLALGGAKGWRPLGPSPASRGPEGGGWAGEGGGRVAPWFLANLLRFPGPDPGQLRGGGL